MPQGVRTLRRRRRGKQGLREGIPCGRAAHPRTTGGGDRQPCSSSGGAGHVRGPRRTGLHSLSQRSPSPISPTFQSIHFAIPPCRCRPRHLHPWRRGLAPLPRHAGPCWADAAWTRGVHRQRTQTPLGAHGGGPGVPCIPGAGTPLSGAPLQGWAALLPLPVHRGHGSSPRGGAGHSKPITLPLPLLLILPL